MNFEQGQTVFIKPKTYHNYSAKAFRRVNFVRYMAGEEFAIVQADGFRGMLRVAVEDLSPDAG